MAEVAVLRRSVDVVVAGEEVQHHFGISVHERLEKVLNNETREL